MASTSLKNLPGYYKQHQKAEHDNREYLLYKHKKIPLKSALPDLGINMGTMAGAYTHDILSNNTSDLESFLFGIGTTNLVKPFVKPKQDTNKLDNIPFYDKPGYCMPKPMVIENRQRPTGPFS